MQVLFTELKLPAENPLLINCSTPTKEEVRRAILTLHNGKAAGPDGIPAEALKTAPCTSPRVGEYHRKTLGGRGCAGRLKRRFLSQITKKGRSE